MIYDGRGNKTIEIDVTSDNKYIGRSAVPSGASVGKYEVINFPLGRPEKCLQQINANSKLFIGLESSDIKCIHDTICQIDKTTNYSKIGGAFAFAITIASIESAAKATNKQIFNMLTKEKNIKFPIPLGNILGGGAHAGNGAPDIQEILVCANNSKSIRDAIEINFSVHKELGNTLAKRNTNFTRGRSDEGGWAPEVNSEKALEIVSKSCENLGYTLGKEISLGVDFASSTLWNEQIKKYVYKRDGFSINNEKQIELVSDLIRRYKLAYVEDAVNQEAFSEMSELTEKFPNTLIVGDDLTVTNKEIIRKAIKYNSCNGVILKVNQAGSLYDALEFAKFAKKNHIKIITSHRSGETNDSHIVHIGIGTNSVMLKIGVVGGERTAKLNELIRISEYDLIHGMMQL